MAARSRRPSRPTIRVSLAYVLDGEAVFGANRRPSKPPQLVLLGPGENLMVTDAVPGTRFLLMVGKPYGEHPCVPRPLRGLDGGHRSIGREAGKEMLGGRPEPGGVAV